MSVTLVVGAQYGSEGKGNLVRHLAHRFDHHVRVGGPNAGHSMQVDGKVYKMQALPCGWANRDAQLYLGAGAVISPAILQREIEMVGQAGLSVRDRLHIDFRATVLDEMHHTLEGGTEGALHGRIGSTGEGVGAARLARLHRDPGQCRLAVDVQAFQPYLEDTVSTLNRRVDEDRSILIEGTQGSGLSITYGSWPHVTTADVNASGLMADVGFAPGVPTQVILVARTFPIRVAGPSGPLVHEMTWEILSAILGREVCERTTVTNKVRRIGRWDDALFEQAVRLNRPYAVCLNFLDYLLPADEGKAEWKDLSDGARRFIDRVEEMAHAPVLWVGTGGPAWAIAERNYEVA